MACRYEGNTEDLGLVFSAEDETFGKRVTIPLVPGGDNIAVTNENKLQYVQLMAEWQLNGRLGGAAASFARGMKQASKSGSPNKGSKHILSETAEGLLRFTISDRRQRLNIIKCFIDCQLLCVQFDPHQHIASNRKHRLL